MPVIVSPISYDNLLDPQGTNPFKLKNILYAITCLKSNDFSLTQLISTLRGHRKSPYLEGCPVEFRENVTAIYFPQGQGKLLVITRCPY